MIADGQAPNKSLVFDAHYAPLRVRPTAQPLAKDGVDK